MKDLRSVQVKSKLVLGICLILELHAALAPAYAEGSDSALMLGVRLPLGANTGSPLRLSLGLVHRSNVDGEIINQAEAQFASLNLNSRGQPVDAHMLGVPLYMNGAFVLNAAESSESQPEEDHTVRNTLIVGGLVLAGLIVIGQEVFKKGSKDIVEPNGN
jgi:hypothetical protein